MKARILLIDDDPGLSEVIGMLLERESYAFERAGTVKAGLERIKAAELDLVIVMSSHEPHRVAAMDDQLDEHRVLEAWIG